VELQQTKVGSHGREHAKLQCEYCASDLSPKQENISPVWHFPLRGEWARGGREIMGLGISLTDSREKQSN
jgi:hypothetical protein